MALIVFMPFHWASDLNPTFALARKLRKHGHRVHYLSIPDTADRIRSQGFDFTPVFSQAFPEGALLKQYESEAQGNLYGVAEFIDRFQGTLRALREGALDHATRELHPDVFLISSGTPWVGIAAYKTGVPVICFSSTLISVVDSAIPPFNSDLIPSDRLGARLQFEKVSAFELGRLIDRVLKDSSYSARAELMSKKLVKLEHESPGVAVIENTLSGKPIG
jgi:UDP:flavonoid glycosyltransferase YjiC (YdhE family)